MEIISIELLLNALAFTGTTLLGVSIYLRRSQSWTHRLFLILAVLINSYIIVNYFSLHPPYPTPENQLFWIRVVMFVTSFIGPILVLFVHTFPHDFISLKKRYALPMMGLMSASAIAALTPLVFSSIQYPNGQPIPIPGPGIFVFVADFIGLFILSFVILIYKYHTTPGEEKKQLLSLLVGILASFSLMGLSTVVFVVILKTSSFVFLGPIFPVILLAFIAYAMIRHRLFNMKVITTQIFVSILVIVLFSKIFIPRSLTETLIDVSIFIMTAIFGILLIRSVIKEVRQREQLQELTAELATANESLKVLDRAKSEFISLASHQLRAPLTVIKGFVSLALEGSLGLIPDKAKDGLQKVMFSATQLIKLVNDLLDLSRIESGRIRYDFKPTDFVALATRVMEEFRQNAEKKGLKISLHNNAGELPPILLDVDKIIEVVTNLVDNAIKYSVAGEVMLTLERVEEGGKGERVRLSVRDTGLGIRPEDISRLFTKFTRTEDARRVDPNGTGIGLYYAHHVTEAHHGTIRVESEGLGKGSTFSVELPMEGVGEINGHFDK